MFNEPNYTYARSMVRQCANGDCEDTSLITRITSSILKYSRSFDACELVGTPYANRERWLAEALLLFNTLYLTPDDRAAMLNVVFTERNYFLDFYKLGDGLIDGLADCCARLGKYGFAFPQWRYPTQSFEGASIVERYGMERLHRPTDILDPGVPPANPNHDLFGPGFVLETKNSYLELRRAYIVYAQFGAHPTTIVIRNSSYYFGRDRLTDPVYVSFEKLSPDELKDMTRNMLESEKFTPWQKMLSVNLPLFNKLMRVQHALNCLDSFDDAFNRWLMRPGQDLKRHGFDHLLAFLKHKLAHPDGGVPFLGTIRPTLPPWFPEVVYTAESLLPDMETYQNGKMARGKLPALLASIRSGLRPTLFSSAEGDFPLLTEKLPSGNVLQLSATTAQKSGHFGL